MEYPEEQWLMLSGLQHFVFCRRQWALIHLEQAWQENLQTAEGMLMHRRAHDAGQAEMHGGRLTLRPRPPACRWRGAPVCGRLTRWNISAAAPSLQMQTACSCAARPCAWRKCYAAKCPSGRCSMGRQGGGRKSAFPPGCGRPYAPCCVKCTSLQPAAIRRNPGLPAGAAHAR